MLLAEAIHANELAVQRASIPELRRLLPILRQAERELGAGLGKWLKKQSPSDTYDRHRHRALVAQLHESIQTVEKRLGPAFAEDVDQQTIHARQIAQAKLQGMVEAGSAQYEGAIRPLRIDVAAIMADERHTMLAQMQTRASKYSKDIVSDINSRLALGMLRGETVDQLTSRLLQSTGLIKVFKARGPDAIAAGASDRMFRTYKWWAESIARTELVNAYAETQARSLREADREDPGWLMKWDAANDWRVCKWCYSLDKTTITPDGMFPSVGKLGARPHPPLHPCCRCSLVPWRREWSASSKRGISRYEKAA